MTNLIRGCGKRVKGGLYACCGTSPFGEPIENFLIDPPQPYKGEPMRAPIVQEKDGVKDLIFWVGQEFYPYCPDYIEETRLFGASKRIPITMDLSGIVPFKSRMFLIHPRAIADTIAPAEDCPKNNPQHQKGDEFCIKALYYFVDAEPADKRYVRRIGSTSYYIPLLLKNVSPEYSPGFFLALPFTHMEYVMPEDGKIDERVKRARDEGAQIALVDE